MIWPRLALPSLTGHHYALPFPRHEVWPIPFGVPLSRHLVKSSQRICNLTVKSSTPYGSRDPQTPKVHAWVSETLAAGQAPPEIKLPVGFTVSPDSSSMTSAATPYYGRSSSSAMRARSSPSPAAAPTSAQTPSSGRFAARWGPLGDHTVSMQPNNPQVATRHVRQAERL